MPTIYQLKPAFQQWLRPILAQWVKWGIRPNHITMAALVLSALGGGLLVLAFEQPLWLLSMPVVLFVRMALNALDGMMAREYQMMSPLGEILNELGDVVADFLLYAPLGLLFPEGPFAIGLWTAFLLLAMLSEFCGVLAKAMIGIRGYEGPMGKSDRAFSMGVLAILMALKVLSVGMMLGYMAVVVVLLLLTCVNRLKGILKGAVTQ